MAHPRIYDPDDPLLARVREIALALPGSDEKESHGRPAFYTRKVFGYYGGSVKIDGVWDSHDQAILFFPDPAERPALEGDDRFWGRHISARPDGLVWTSNPAPISTRSPSC